MHSLDITIAEHHLVIDVISDHLKDWILQKFILSIPNEYTSVKQIDLFISVEEGYGTPFENFDVEIKVGEEFVSYFRNDYLIQAKRDFSEATLMVYDETSLNHALITLYSAFITYRQWGLMIHSSCIVDHGHAYLFAGQSGAGKSTVAALSSPTRMLLSDEAALVKVTNGRIQVFNSPFRSDTVIKAEENASVFDLKGCHILLQSKQIKRVPMHRSKAMIHLLNITFYWPYLPEETAKVIAMSREFINFVPFYELYFQKNDLFWGEIHEHSYEQYV